MLPRMKLEEAPDLKTRVLVLDKEWELISKGNTRNLPRALGMSPLNLFSLIFTSGSS